MALDYATSLPGPADSVGGRIRQARRFRELSQIDFSRRIGSSRDTVINYEKNRFSPTVEVLLLISRETGFPVRWFVDGLEANADDLLRGWGSNPRPAD